MPSVSLAAVLLAGCAVAPQELRPGELASIADANLSSVKNCYLLMIGAIIP